MINYTIIFFSRKEVTLKHNCYVNSNYNHYLQIWVSKLCNLSRKVLILGKIQGKGQRKLKLIFFSSKTDPPGNVMYFTSVVVTQGIHIGES